MSCLKKYNEIFVEIDLQLLASEMDASLKELVFLHDAAATDCNDIEFFEKIWHNLKESVSLVSIDDDTEIYEYGDIVVATHETMTDKFIICRNTEYHKIKLV